MFSKLSTLSVSLGLLALSTHVSAHCAIVPMLGVTGTPARSDVQQPSTAKPCGSVNVASTLDTSTPVQAAADGTFTVNATDFNAGADGSRSVTAKVDPTAAGKTFSTAVTVSQNGIAAPKTVGTDQITASLPAGTTCSGGTSGNLCLVQFTTTAGFGNCVVVAQGAGTAAAANGTAASNAATTAANGTAATTATTATNGTTADSTTTTTDGTATNGTAATGTTTTTGAAGKHHKHKHAGAAAAAGNAAAGNAAAAGTAAAGTAATAGTAAGSTAAGTAATGDADCGDAAAGTAATGNEAKANFKAGSRAPRALLHNLETRGEEALGVVRRGVLGWMWA